MAVARRERKHRLDLIYSTPDEQSAIKRLKYLPANNLRRCNRPKPLAQKKKGFAAAETKKATRRSLFSVLQGVQWTL